MKFIDKKGNSNNDYENQRQNCNVLRKNCVRNYDKTVNFEDLKKMNSSKSLMGI